MFRLIAFFDIEKSLANDFLGLIKVRRCFLSYVDSGLVQGSLQAKVAFEIVLGNKTFVNENAPEKTRGHLRE